MKRRLMVSIANGQISGLPAGNYVACGNVPVGGGAACYLVSNASFPAMTWWLDLSSLAVNTAFNAASMPSAAQDYHAALLNALAHLTDANPATRTIPDLYANAASQDSRTMARWFQQSVMAVLHAFRATHDRALLDALLPVMDVAFANLSDADGDGEREWLDPDRQPPTDDSMNTVMYNAVLASWCRVMQVNTAVDPAYAASYSQWRTYLDEHIAVKGALFARAWDLTHCWVHGLRLAWTLYQITGNAAFLDEYTASAAALENSMVYRVGPSGIARLWDHRVYRWPPFAYNPEGVQLTGYASYTIQCMADLWLSGAPGFDDAYMRSLTATALDWTFPSDLDHISDDIASGVILPGENLIAAPPVVPNYTSDKWCAWGWSALSPFDVRFDALNVAGLARYGVPTLIVPSYQLLAACRRAAYADEGATDVA